MNLIQQIKSQFRIKDYAKNELNLRLINDRCISILGGSNNTACVFYENFFYDFKHEIGGDVIDLCALVKHNGDKGAAIRELSEILGIYDNNHEKWKSYTQNLCNYIEKCHCDLQDEQRAYINKRKITDETITRLKIGNENGRILIPYWKNGYISYYITRGKNPPYKKAKLDGLNENSIWGQHTLARNKENLFITEGAFDGISFDQEKQAVISTMGGTFNQEQMCQAIDICRLYQNVFLCFDNDKAGNKFLIKMSQDFIKNKIRFKCIVPEGYNDISEYYEKNETLLNLVTKAVDGFIFLANHIKKEDELADFCRKISIFTSKLDIKIFFKHLKNVQKFDLIFLTELEKQCTSAPAEDFIVKLVAKKKCLKHIEGMGLHEYKDGKWDVLTDEAGKQYVATELNRHRTGGKVRSIYELIKSEVHTSDEFNFQPIINFKNGILDLKTSELLPHSPSYMSTFQCPYNYIEDAWSERWIEFLLDITGEDKGKMDLLQEMAGYILFNDNSLQKAFFLIGKGANGKSVFLDILESLFPKSAVTHIEMSDLIEGFQRVHLAKSVLNLASDAATSFKNSESYFKKAVTGDSMSASFKQQQFFSFSTRAKFFTSCNKFIKTKDTTDGFLRRIVFIRFENRYVDNPIFENEKKVDRAIFSKLKKDIPAIFNWAYVGYKKLKTKMFFTELPEQREMMNEYREIMDNTYSFILERIVGKRISFINRESIYIDYRNWCTESSLFPKSKQSFLQSIRNSTYATSLNIIIKEKRNKGNRGFEIQNLTKAV